MQNQNPALTLIIGDSIIWQAEYRRQQGLAIVF